jgi:hypothetical protein
MLQQEDNHIAMKTLVLDLLVLIETYHEHSPCEETRLLQRCCITESRILDELGRQLFIVDLLMDRCDLTTMVRGIFLGAHCFTIRGQVLCVM